MTIETDLSVAPYFDEAEAGLEKNYYKILFKPSVPVQVRELNELQTILQRQIEEFGDNILKKGTIIRGCTFSFFNRYPYIKIKDSQVDGAPVNLSALIGKTLVSSTGDHKAIVLDYADGFESTDPDTKTLYLRYVNAGNQGNSSSFTSGDILTVQDPNYSISNVTITLAGTGYSNSSAVVFTSALAIQDVVGTINIGDTMTQPTTGANAVVIAVDSTSYPNKTILKVRPLAGDLSDSSKTSNNWTFSVSEGIVSLTNAAVTAAVTEVIGAGASAVVTTDATQRVTDVSMVAGGSGYYVAPYVTVRSTLGGSGVSLIAQNYSSKITIFGAGSNPVGYGYGFGVSAGVVYQKGYFLNVPEQTVVVSKYSRFPNNLSVGFTTSENIVDAYEDTSLLDNSLGTRNYTAPGADRLQLIPRLEVTNTDISKANLEFFSIVEFSDGVPYKQNQRTAYNGINDEMALRTVESAGDFVTDQFLLACKSTTDVSLRANNFTVVVDPGQAYIDGYRVKTYGNYQFTLEKGIDTEIKSSATVSLNYGSYVVVDNLAGSFDFSAVGLVRLYDTPADYLSTASKYSGGTITPAGSQIGTAKVRCITYADSSATGYPQGSAESKYNMYIFDIQMIPGKSFKDVRSIFYNSSPAGIADVVTEKSPTGLDVAVLKNTVSNDKKSLDKLVFYSGFDSPLAINTISYQYRTFNDTGSYTISNSGVMQITLSGNEYFPYNTDLTDPQKQQLVIMPLQNLYANTQAGGSGNVSISSSANTLTSTNASFTTPLRVGDYLRLSSNATGGSELRKIVRINPGSSIQLDANPSFTNSAASITRAFPKFVPFPILTREGITATADISGQQLTIDLGTRLEGGWSSNSCATAFNISVIDSPITTKSANRDLFVKIYPGNNTTGFGYSEYGSGVDAYFTSGSVVVANTDTTAFSAGQNLKIVQGQSSFIATIGTITNTTFMNLVSAVNFTGNADVYAAVNLNGPWCLGVPDIFRLKAVYIANTSAVNVNSLDVTRDFVIDHNHNTNYADLGYLVKKKDSSLVIGPNDYLLVKFDAFTRNYEDKPVLVNSYVSPVAATRFTTDAKSLSQLNNSYINTLEIPEIHSSTGVTYDMISHIDFRPKVANTANLSTTVAGATINPAYTVTFSAANKKFPVPDSNMTFNTEYFLGRIDTVYMGSDGRVGAAKGHPYPITILNTTDPDDLLTPISNENTMVLNNIKVPAYPSIEENAATSLTSVINKSVINDIRLTKRITSKKITRLLTKQDLEHEQPRRYSMEDIGSLERRIRDLEYYVSLSNLELSIKDLNLPSSISPNINRFKFGFFADAFDDTTYSDPDSIEYSAMIESNRVIPTYETIKIEITGDECPYTDYSIVSQSKATGDPVTVSPPVCVATASLQTTQGGEVKSGGERVKSLYITMASDLGTSSGEVRVYLYFYSGADVMRIYQSSTANNFPATPILTTAAASPLTSADINYMNGLPDGFFGKSGKFRTEGINLTKHKKVNSPANGLRYAGKITFNHNPANGRYYRIDVANHSIVWRYRIEYPINVSCAPSAPVNPAGPPNFQGTIKTHGIKEVKVSNPAVKATFYRVHMSINGLKPSSTHKLYFAGQDLTHLCDTSIRDTVVPIPPAASTAINSNWQTYASQIPDFFNDAPDGYIMTDASGRMEMYLYVLKDEDLPISGKKNKYNKKLKDEYDLVTNPVVEIYNADKSSYTHLTMNHRFQLFSGFRVK